MRGTDKGFKAPRSEGEESAECAGGAVSRNGGATVGGTLSRNGSRTRGARKGNGESDGGPGPLGTRPTEQGSDSPLAVDFSVVHPLQLSDDLAEVHPGKLANPGEKRKNPRAVFSMTQRRLGVLPVRG